MRTWLKWTLGGLGVGALGVGWWYMRVGGKPALITTIFRKNDWFPISQTRERASYKEVEAALPGMGRPYRGDLVATTVDSSTKAFQISYVHVWERVDGRWAHVSEDRAQIYGEKIYQAGQLPYALGQRDRPLRGVLSLVQR